MTATHDTRANLIAQWQVHTQFSYTGTKGRCLSKKEKNVSECDYHLEKTQPSTHGAVLLKVQSGEE